jgi:hypothetical protein
VVIALVAILGCQAASQTGERAQSALGGTPGTAVGVTERGGYIDAGILTGTTSLRFFFPADEVCRAILREEARVLYVRRGPMGAVENDAGDSCSPVGIASLREWRDRQPRPRRDEPLPRARIDFRVTYKDDDLVFARGRWPLANQIGWAGGEDTIALLPNSEGCAGPIESGVGTMQFQSTGRVPFRIVGRADCPIVGFVQPLRGN